MLEDLFRLDGKVIVITGATGLLGRKHAEAVACYGGTPILLDLSQKAVDSFATPQEIADSAVFLCSDRAGFITGTTLVIDGGQTTKIL